MNPTPFIARLSSRLFWDTDPAEIDPERHAGFVIARVMDRGSRDDVRVVWEHYGPERVREALIQAPALEAKTISFFANQFDLAPERFRAFDTSRKEGGNWKA